MWRPTSPEALPGEVAEWLDDSPGLVRCAVDGAPCTDPDAFAGALVDPLQARGRPVAHVRAESFWRDASLRFEHGREDVEAYLGWLDAAALRREVLDTAVAEARYLPSLRDPRSNRAAREAPRPLAPNAVLLVSGPLLLGLGLPFERTLHLALSPAALARRTPAEQAWTLLAYARYEESVRPDELADLVIKLDDPHRPAARRRT